MNSYTMVMDYTILQPTDATLSMEYYSSGKKYHYTVDGKKDPVIVYENDGKLYADEAFAEELEFVPQYENGDTKYTVIYADGTLMLALGAGAKEVVFYESAKIAGTNRYNLDGIPNIMAEVVNGKVRLVTEETIRANLQESQDVYTYESDYIVLKGSDASYKVNAQTAPEAGEGGALTETEVTVIGNSDVTIVIRSDGKYYIKTPATEEGGEPSYTELENAGHEAIGTDYAPLLETVLVVDDAGNEVEATGYFTLDGSDAELGTRLYYNIVNGDMYLYYLADEATHKFEKYGNLQYTSKNNQLIYSATNYITYGGYENLSSNAEVLRNPTGVEILSYTDGRSFADGKISRGGSNATAFEIHSYVTNEDLSNGVLVIRPGSINPGGNSTLTIDGPVAREDASSIMVPIKPVTVRANSQTGNATPGYRITDTLYLTQSGLVVNLVVDGNKVTFASKFDGIKYESDNIAAENFGYLGQEREFADEIYGANGTTGENTGSLDQDEKLSYDINGMIHYGGKTYLRMGNILAEFLDGTLNPLSVAESNQILYKVAPSTTNAPSIMIRNGQQIWLERLSPEICKDFQGRYWYLPADASAPMLAAAVPGTAKNTANTTAITHDGKTYLVISYDAAGNLCFDMPLRNVIAKSNGDIVRTDNTPADITVSENTTTDVNYAIGQIGTAGENNDIKITLVSPVVSLVSAVPGQNLQNIQTNGGNITIIADSTGSVGQNGESLVIDAAGGSVNVQKSENSTVVAVNTYLVLREDTRLTPDNIIVDGVIYQVVGNAQNAEDKVDITGNSIRAINGATLDISTDGTLYLNYLGVDDRNSTGNSKANLVADGNVGIEALVSGAGATDITSTDGAVAVESLTANGAEVTINSASGFESDLIEANDADIKITNTTTGDVTVTDMNVEGGKSEITNNGGAVVIDELTASEADVTVNSATGFESDLIEANDADIKITNTTTGDVSIDEMNAHGGITTVTNNGGSIVMEKLNAVDGATVTADATGEFRVQTVTASAEGDSAAPIIKVCVDGDITLDTLDIEDTSAEFVGEGMFTARYVEADRSYLKIDVLDDLRIFDETNDEISGSDQVKDVLVLRDMNAEDTVKGTTIIRGADLTSRNGAVDSTHDDYNVYTAADGSAYFLQDGKWYELATTNGSKRFVKLDVAPDLSGFADRGKFSLYIGTSDKNSSIYVQEYDGVLILERSGDFYRISGSDIEKDEHLSSNFIDAQKLLNVGARNYYDSWFADAADLTVTSKGDIQVRDSVRMTNYTNATMTAGGGIIFADYYMDTDGDGIGDKLEPSRYLVKNSVVNLSALGGDVRTDRVYVETSFAAIDDCTGDVNSKTWYILGSKVPMNLDGDVNVVSLDAADAGAVPAVQILWSNEDFFIYLRMGDVYEYVRTGVEITSLNGGVHIEAMDGNVSASNTLDLYSVASTVKISAAKDVKIPEFELNTPNDKIKLDDGETTATANVYHDLIFRKINENFVRMNETEIPDPAEHAYGTVMSVASTEGKFLANHIKVDSALKPDGELYKTHGISELDVRTGGDINVIYNLSDRTPEHINQYGANIADRALTVRDGSKVKLQSVNGAVTVLNPNGDGSVADIILQGTNTEKAQLQLIADDSVTTGIITAEQADLYIRTTGEETDTAANDILVNQILGTDARVELDSAGNILPMDADENLFVKLEGDVTLRLSATLDIGTLDKFAHIDVPCTVYVDNVTNLYADLNLRDTDGDQIIPEIRDYAISQGYLTSDADAMVQKLITIAKDDYLGHADLRFYNILLAEETLEQIRTALNLEKAAELTADDLINGFALLDDQTRNEVLTALYSSAVSNGQGLEEVEKALEQQDDALKQVLTEKQNLVDTIAMTNPEQAEVLKQLQQKYEELLVLESGIRERINELNARKAEIQDEYRDYVAEDPEMGSMKAEANDLLTQAQLLNTESEQFAADAEMLRMALDALLRKLVGHVAFSEESLKDARAIAAVVLNAAKTASDKAAAAEQAALEELILSGEFETEYARKEAYAAAVENLLAKGALAKAWSDLEADAYNGTRQLSNIFVDVPARGTTVVIGEIEGELYLTNEGDIDVLVDSERTITSLFDEDPASHIDVKANTAVIGQILSRRGDVSVENINGAIGAKKLAAGEVNILADEINLKAKGSIGTSADQPLVTEQRDVIPSKVGSVADGIYKNQTAGETVNGAALPGQGVIGIQLAERYDELTDSKQTVTVTLLMADGTQVETNMELQDLRELTKQANTTDGYVYNFLTDEKATAAALQVVVRYDWVRYLNPEAGTRTDAESETGSVYISEQTGKLNIGQIKAAEDIYISAPDGVYSVLTEEEIASGKQNILASGDASKVNVLAGTGGIGESDNPLRVQVSGDNALMHTESEDGIYLRGTGDLNLEFIDPSRHVEIELIEADIPGGIANLKVNDLTVGGADVLTGYTKSLGSLELHTDADVGTKEEPFEIVTDATKGGTLILSGNDVNIVQKNGDLLAENLVAKGDLQATVGGSIVDASDSELTELLKQYREQLADANAQQEVLDQLHAEWDAIMNNNAEENRKQELIDARENAAREQAEYDAAAKARADAAEALEEAKKILAEARKSGDETAIQAAEEALAAAEENLKLANEALKEANEQNKQAQERLQKAEWIEVKFENLQKTKDELKAAYADGNAGRINSALAAYKNAREDTAPYTDFIKRNESDRDVAEQILKDAFGDDFRTELDAADDDVRKAYQPLIDMLDKATQNLDKANARLDELNADASTGGSIAQAQKNLDEKKQTLADLIEQIQNAKEQGDGLAIQAGGNADIRADGSISGSTENPDDYVGIQIGGQLNVESDGAVKLISPDDVDVGSAKTNKNELGIISLGDVKVGTTDAEKFSGAGDNVDVKLEGDAELGDIIADNESGKVSIDADGSLTQEQGTAIRGNELKVEASGDVKLDLYVDNVQIGADGDVDLTSGKSHLTVEQIDAGGNVEIDGTGELLAGGKPAITAGGSVNLNMGSNIGNVDNELVVKTDGEVVWNTTYGTGHVNVIRSGSSEQMDRLWDDPDSREYYVRKEDGSLERNVRPGTGLEVFGYDLQNAFLWVGTEQLRKTLFAEAQNQFNLKITVNGEIVFDYWVAIDRIVERILTDGKLIPVIEWDKDGTYSENVLTFQYYVGHEYDGYRYTVSVVRDGTATEITGTVVDGCIVFQTVNQISSVTVDVFAEV